MILVTSHQMRQFDKHTIDSLHVPGIVLMEHAGKAVAEAVLNHGAGRVCVLCGKGNNGGDGWIAARWLKHKGIFVTVYSLTSPENLVGDAQKAFDMAQLAEVPFTAAGSEDKAPLANLPDADVYVDALLGTGTSRPLTGSLKQVVDWVNRQENSWVLSVDVPTGVDGSTGEVQGKAVRADATLCLGAQKLGTAVAPGCYFAGEVRVADIGISVAAKEIQSGIAESVDVKWMESRWRKRCLSAHKGTFGRLGIAVGSMTGAPVLAGLGAARSGAGLVVLGLPDEQAVSVQAPVEFVLRSVREFTSPFADCTAIVVGPGLGATAPQWVPLVTNWKGVGVVDADGLLPALEKGPLGERWVLTPHPKECAKLLGWTTEDVQNHRAKAAETLARESGCVVVLKGYHTLIAAPDRPLLINFTGNEALATAGTGDVLAGVIGSFLAQGITPREAAAMGAWLHGRAGELAGDLLSSFSVLASDVVENISRAIRLHFDS